jgi:hypothetical protein
MEWIVSARRSTGEPEEDWPQEGTPVAKADVSARSVRAKAEEPEPDNSPQESAKTQEPKTT